MSSSSGDRNLQTLWQSQPSSGRTMSLDEIRQHAARLEHRVARRNLREYVAAVLVVAAYGCGMWLIPSPLIRVGAVLIIAATALVVWRLHRWGRTQPLPSDLALKPALVFHRSQLERQRDGLNSVWRWYLLPFVPGLLVLVLGAALEPRIGPERAAGFALGTIAVMIGGHVLNRRAAARLQRYIDRLDTDH
jgi:hypothetical protein